MSALIACRVMQCGANESSPMQKRHNDLKLEKYKLKFEANEYKIAFKRHFDRFEHTHTEPKKNLRKEKKYERNVWFFAQPIDITRETCVYEFVPRQTNCIFPPYTFYISHFNFVQISFTRTNAPTAQIHVHGRNGIRAC